jgi:hypothetical protein
MRSCSSRVLLIAIAMFFGASCQDAGEAQDLDIERAVEEAKQMWREDIARYRDVERELGFHATYHIRAMERGILLLETLTPEELAEPSLVSCTLAKVHSGPGYFMRPSWIELGFRAHGLRFRVDGRLWDYPRALPWPDEIKEEYAHGVTRSFPVFVLLEGESDEELDTYWAGVVQVPWDQIPQKLELALLYDELQQTEFVEVLLPHQIDE